MLTGVSYMPVGILCYKKKDRKERMMDQEKEFMTGIGREMPSSRREMEEDLLEQICILAGKTEMLTVSDVSSELDMPRRDVNYYLKQMRKHGYVEETAQEDGEVRLTELGRITGAECRHRHDTFTQFLQYIGVEREKASEDACRMEHVVSEETVQKICDFVNYGETYERVFRGTDLKNRYLPGEYEFLMGIYYTEKICPRRLSREFEFFSENIRFYVTEERSWFELQKKKPYVNRLWYRDPENGWVKAEERDGNPMIPSKIFAYSMRRPNPVTEGTALVAFAREGEVPAEWNSRELDVHIW